MVSRARSSIAFVSLIGFSTVSGCKQPANEPGSTPGSAISSGPSPDFFAPLPGDYEKMTACAKQNFLWNQKVLATRYPAGQMPKLEAKDGLRLLFTALRDRLELKMDTKADQTPPNWRKVIHRRATLGKVEFIPEADSPYTGVFRGNQCGLLRLSVTGDPKDGPFNPGIAWKALIDHQPSADISALVSLDGQGTNTNFFANDYANMLRPSASLALKLAGAAFSTASKHPHKISPKFLAKYLSTGEEVTNPKAPILIFFSPTPIVNKLIPENSNRDFREEIEMKLKPGMPIFELLAVEPDASDQEIATDMDKFLQDPEYRRRAKKFGTIVVTSQFVASAWGDDGIMIRHHRFNDE